MSYDPVAAANAVIASRLREPSVSLADQRQPTRTALRAALWDAFARARTGWPSARRAGLFALLGPVTEDEHLERVAREEASRCSKCGAYPDGACLIADEGGLCRRVA